MEEGTIFAVPAFPVPWPPSTEWSLVSRQDSDLSLVANSEGRIIATLTEANKRPRTFRFQRIRVVGSGRAVLSLTWSGDHAELHLNGREVLLEHVAEREEFVLETSTDPIRQGRLLPAVDVVAAKSETERWFLETLVDIDLRLVEGSRYNLIRGAGLLRQLLLDEQPLMHRANRAYGVEITFEVIPFRKEPLFHRNHTGRISTVRRSGSEDLTGQFA